MRWLVCWFASVQCGEPERQGRNAKQSRIWQVEPFKLQAQEVLSHTHKHTRTRTRTPTGWSSGPVPNLLVLVVDIAKSRAQRTVDRPGPRWHSTLMQTKRILAGGGMIIIRAR